MRIAAQTTEDKWEMLEVVNGNFEETPVSETDIPGWDYWNGGNQAGMSISQDRAFEGVQSLKVHNDGVVGLFSQEIPVVEGETYRLKAQLFIDELTSGNPGIWLRWLNDQGEIIRNSPKYFENLPLQQWNEVFIEAVAPPEAKGVKIFIYQTTVSKMIGYYDQIQLFKKVTAIPIDLQNPGFEKASIDGKIPNWEFYPSQPGDGTSISLSQDTVYEGAQSVKIIDDSNQRSVGLYSAAVKIEPNKVYRVQGRAFIQSGSISIYLKYYDQSGNEIGSYSTGYDSPKNQWIQIIAEGKAPADSVTAKVFLYAGVAGTSSAYYDAFQLSVKEQLELPFEYGNPINYGPAALAAKAQGTAIGNGEIYFVTNGSPGTFYANDANTGDVIFSQPIPGIDVVWGLTIGSDGNVYFSGTYDGILHRYLVHEKRIEQVGKNPSDDWVWELEASENGKIYGATYPNAKVFEYDIETNQFTDLGSIHPGEQYARGLGVTDNHLYVGIGTTAYLYQINRETGEKTEINLPITGQETSISNIWEYENRLFVAYGTSLIVMDIITGEVVKEMNWEDEHTFDGLISPPSPVDSRLIYFRNKNTSELWTYDLNTNEIQPVEPRIELPPSSVKAYKWVALSDGTSVLAILHHQIEFSIYNPETNGLEVIYPKSEMQGLAIQSLEIGEDDKIYMGGYQGSMGVFDTSREVYLLRERNPHQIEGIGFLNGKVYMGTYGGARIYEYNPNEPYLYTDGGPGNNPEMVCDIGAEQSRPFTFTAGDNKLFIGTIPDYGRLGGALTIFDAETDEWKSIRNIIPNQSIVGLAYLNGVVYGGSSIFGGLGIEPIELAAKMFAYNVSTEEIEVFDLGIADFQPEMIGELSIGPDHNLWGIAWGYGNDGMAKSFVFAMSPESREILKSTELYPGVHRGSQWRPFFIRWSDEGLLYTTVARRLTVIDPETMLSQQLISDIVNLMDLDREGNIYYASGENLYKLPVPLHNAFVSIADNPVIQGSETNVDLTVTLANGKTADLAGAAIEWFHSDSQVAVIENGMLIAKNAGSTDVYATVAYNGETITSNPITVIVEVTTSSLITQIKALEEAGQLRKSISIPLISQLTQAQHQFDKGEIDQAIKHLQDCIKLLEKSDEDKEIITLLINNVKAIEASFRKHL
ncbi:carbohydrate binding domain-containing protein [Bacillus litorisediminis]|uniref:carbohydrate binding domain-containing protein n=1 Tax=Bacillus litorisediminis TaxID=2922713 RepID=UPI001FAFB8A9|nr:carbohydrate binding domain-containing protein [Bacillus litorisediminis]